MLTLSNLHGIAQSVALIPLSPSFLLYQRGSRQIVGRNMDIRFQLTILFHRESIETGKVLLLAIDAACSTVLIDIPDLPWLQAQSEQLCAISRIGIKSKTLKATRRLLVIITRRFNRTSLASRTSSFGGLL